MRDEPTAIEFNRLHHEDARELCQFYNNLSRSSIRTFRPLGLVTTLAVCRALARDNAPDRDRKFDWLAWRAGVIVGWGFLWNLDTPEPGLGLGVADELQGRGVGARLANDLMEEANRRQVDRVNLIVVRDNSRAQSIYERLGFQLTGEFVGEPDGLTYLRMAAELRRMDPTGQSPAD